MTCHPDEEVLIQVAGSPDFPSGTGAAASKTNIVARGLHKVVKRGKEVSQQAVDTAVVVGKKGTSVAGSVWSDFKTFVAGRNVFDLAVGVVMGTAFTTAVNSVVVNIFNPILALMFQSKDLENAYAVVRCPNNQTSCGIGNWATPTIAQAAGAVTFNWGALLLAFINLGLTCAIVFFIYKLYSAAFRRTKAPESVSPATKSCHYCMNDIPIKAHRCGFCTSHLSKWQKEDDDLVTVDLD